MNTEAIWSLLLVMALAAFLAFYSITEDIGTSISPFENPELREKWYKIACIFLWLAIGTIGLMAAYTMYYMIFK